MTHITLLDGGMSRELVLHGATLKQPEWSALALMNEPEKVRVAHDAFIAAGAQIITTNNYAVVPFHIGEAQFAKRGRELIAGSGKIARDAANAAHGVLVAGSLPPPCGSYLPLAFDVAEGERVVSMMLHALEDHVDLWLAETISSLAEARVTAATVRASGTTQKPLYMSFSLLDSEAAMASRQTLLRSGEAVDDAIALALDFGASAIMFNCSKPEVMEPAIRLAHQRVAQAGVPVSIGVYANNFASQAGVKRANEVIASGRDDLDPTAYIHWVDRWIGAGATIVGGCCGITSPHIAALNQHLNTRQMVA
ncbi:MAG: homocysteine S-methyltransferase family protein [Pseudomonadota bacterium]